MDTYSPGRPPMNRAELAKHEMSQQGRDCRFSSPNFSDDGYGDIEVATKLGWTAVSSWGHDGWDLGNWPYVVISIRNVGDLYCGAAWQYQMRQTVEGDTTNYGFASAEDRNAAIDYLFGWYAAKQDWWPSGITRGILDARRARRDGGRGDPAQVPRTVLVETMPGRQPSQCSSSMASARDWGATDGRTLQANQEDAP